MPFFSKPRYYLSRLLHGGGSLTAVANDCTELCPEETTTEPPAIYVPEHLERIQAVHYQSSREHEMARINGGTRTHAATQAFELSNARIDASALYCRNYRRVFPAPKHPPEFTPTNPDEPYALVSSYVGTQYFGDWLCTDASTYLLADGFGTPLTMPTEPWGHKRIYADIFGQDWTHSHRGAARTLYLFEDYSQNSHKVARYRQLRAALRRRYEPGHPGGRVYLRRGSGGVNKRHLVNEDAIIERLSGQGFSILDVSSQGLDELLTGLLDAELVVTIEGSHQNHSLYTLADQGSLLLINPPSLFNNVAKDWTEALGMQYGFVVAEAAGEDAFRVEPDEILQLAEKMGLH